MKRPNSSDSLGALMSIGPRSADEEHVNNQETTTMSGFQDECCVSEKKRRLSNEQVKALEKYFEVENKLEPERKVKLALELGLQPRQVAVWFQNRRARWKTKNLERDFGVLKANYDALKQDFETLQRDNESLFEEIRELKSKLNEDDSKSESHQVSARKEEPFVSVTALELDFDDDNSNNNVEPYKNHLFVLCDSKDGSSDSDSSAILNDDDKNKSCIPLLDRRESSKIHNGSSSPTPMNVIFQLSSSEDSATNNVIDDNSKEDYQIEENNLFGEEDESCTTKFFSDEQAPTLNWYNPDEWN